MTRHRAKPGSRSRRLLPGEREKLIVGEAIRFFSEVGFSGQTRELSRRLGITQPLLYRYFPSKRALRDALGLPEPRRTPVTPFEMELAWHLHGEIFYYCVRKHVYGSRVHQDLGALIENAVDSLLLGAPKVLGRLLGRKRNKLRR